ncbi:MAG: hypothetical protein IT160_09425 [Bryobacterales bacterium]|nr:hypothetical protein [Bryobacterales bacterium]
MRALASAIFTAAMAVAAPSLSPRLAEVPFCYPCGATRIWPLLNEPLESGTSIKLKIFRGSAELARSTDGKLSFEGLQLEAMRNGRLRLESGAKDKRSEFDLRIELNHRGGRMESETLRIRPAPPVRPVTYYADFGDDLINIFGAGLGGGPPIMHHQLREGGAAVRRAPSRGEDSFIRYEKAGFDQYFRRLQCQGVASEILWLFPYPFLTAPDVYSPRATALYRRQAEAILHDPVLTQIVVHSKSLTNWGWIRDLLPLRLNPRVGRDLSQSATEHGIQLGVSYRPFEHAAAKYYQLPAFESDGRFLWMFQPLSSPAVNFEAETVGFAHYRALTRAVVTTIELRTPDRPDRFLERFHKWRDNLRILVSGYPPIQTDSLVLVRNPQGAFRLAPFGRIARRADAQRLAITDFQLEYEPSRGVVIRGLRIPSGPAYIVIDNPSGQAPLTLVRSQPVRLLAADGTTMGRDAAYVAFAETSPEFKATRIAGIQPDGNPHAVFFATEASGTLLFAKSAEPRLDTAALVINRGEEYSREMVDYNLPAARRNAIRELAAILRHPAFNQIYVNTRSHTSLAAESGDGEAGIGSLAAYRAAKKPAGQLGIDLAYTPRGAVIGSLTPAAIMNFTPGEWKGFCQTPECPFPWRYRRNEAIAHGIRKLLEDVQQSFPEARLRIVLPERAAVAQAMARLQQRQPAGTEGYTGNRNNYIANIGEGLALLDLTGTRFETVLLGVGPFVAGHVLNEFLDRAIPDASGHRHSSYQGPSGIMYEGQWTLKDEAGRRARERNLCLLLSRPESINEVILYEAADWTYRLPWDGFEFLASCPPPHPAAAQ